LDDPSVEGARELAAEPTGVRNIEDSRAKLFGHRPHGLDTVGRPCAEQVEILGGRSRDQPPQDEAACPQ